MTQELVGVVNGIQAAHNYARLSPRRLEEFEDEIRAFAALDAPSLTHKQLQQYARWLNRLDKAFKDLDEVLARAQKYNIQRAASTRLSQVKHRAYALLGIRRLSC